MKRVFTRYLVPLLSISTIALVACYYFLNFITVNNLEIAKEKFENYNKEKQRELLIKNQVNEIKILTASLKVKWENLKQNIHNLNLLDYKKNEFGKTVYELTNKSKLLLQIYIVENSGKKPHLVYGGIENKGFDFKKHTLVKKKILDKLDYEDEHIKINGKPLMLLCSPYYTGKLITIFSLDNFSEEITTLKRDSQYLFLLKEDQILQHSDLNGMTKSEAQNMIKPYIDSFKIHNRSNQLDEHLAVMSPVFDNNHLLLFSMNAIENDVAYKKSWAVFESIFEENKKENYKDLIFWLIGISLITLILGAYFAHTNSKPIIELKDKINSVIEGDFNVRMEYKANNELDDVADSFNTMISLIQNNREDLINQKNKINSHKIELEESNQLLENFAYIVSHDLKQPIRNIGAFTKLLNNSDSLNIEERKHLELITSSCDSMINIVNGFLDFSSLGINENTLLVEVALNNVLETALFNNDTLIKENNSKITYSALPIITGDRDQLVSLFQNLIANAVKFSKGKPQIVISSNTENGYHKIKIKDSGIGIAAENLTDIFQLYKQIRKGKGNGIGLAVCKRIVDLHNGAISVTSELNKGSTFTIEFPVSRFGEKGIS